MDPPEQQEIAMDVEELCAVLQCFGFRVKSLDTSECNTSQDSAGQHRTVVVNCHVSGRHVVLEGAAGGECSCPRDANTSGVWQVSSISKGVMKETGGTLVRSPRARALIREVMAKLERYVDKEQVEEEPPKMRPPMFAVANMSSSMTDLNVTPPGQIKIKVESPPKYRSLDTLTNVKTEQQLPEPGLLVAKPVHASDTSDLAEENVNTEVKPPVRQETYTISTPQKDKVDRLRTKTSSPLRKQSDNTLVDELQQLRNKLSAIIDKLCGDDSKHDSSVASLALDVSKISLLKGPEPVQKGQYVSSPNLSGMRTVQEHEDSYQKRLDSSSTSQLLKLKASNSTGKTVSRLKRLSPSFLKRSTPVSGKGEPSKLLPRDSKVPRNFNSMIRQRPTSLVSSSASYNVNDSSSSTSSVSSVKRRFQHVKSTIPKPTYTPPRKD